jgi:hypothetical protein
MPVIHFKAKLTGKKQKMNDARPYREGASFASGMTATDCNGASQPKHLATWVLSKWEKICAVSA